MTTVRFARETRQACEMCCSVNRARRLVGQAVTVEQHGRHCDHRDDPEPIAGHMLEIVDLVGGVERQRVADDVIVPRACPSDVDHAAGAVDLDRARMDHPRIAGQVPNRDHERVGVGRRTGPSVCSRQRPT